MDPPFELLELALLNQPESISTGRRIDAFLEACPQACRSPLPINNEPAIFDLYRLPSHNLSDRAPAESAPALQSLLDRFPQGCLEQDLAGNVPLH